MTKIKQTDQQLALSQKKVKSFVITIEWKKSRQWGANPHAYAKVCYADGTQAATKTFKASGCGYCKESTVIADVFNDLLKYKLYALNGSEKLPYGISIRNDYRWFEGGVGVSCYYRISEFLGGKFAKIASGSSFDVFTFNEDENVAQA